MYNDPDSLFKSPKERHRRAIAAKVGHLLAMIITRVGNSAVIYPRSPSDYLTEDYLYN
jgi:hypothetical protein